MRLRNSLSRLSVLLTILALSLSTYGLDDKKKKDKEAKAEGTPILWQEPADITTRDLYLGSGGEALKPDLSHVTFVKEETGGYSKKYHVRDGAGRAWNAKL